MLVRLTTLKCDVKVWRCLFVCVCDVISNKTLFKSTSWKYVLFSLLNFSKFSFVIPIHIFILSTFFVGIEVFVAVCSSMVVWVASLCHLLDVYHCSEDYTVQKLWRLPSFHVNWNSLFIFVKFIVIDYLCHCHFLWQ